MEECPVETLQIVGNLAVMWRFGNEICRQVGIEKIEELQKAATEDLKKAGFDAKVVVRLRNLACGVDSSAVKMSARSQVNWAQAISGAVVGLLFRL